MKSIRINIGCGQTPTEGWVNYDNSFSVLLAKVPFFPKFLKKLKVLDEAQFSNIQFCSKNRIIHADITKGLPLKNNSVEVIYTSHMLEHLDKTGVDKFMKEALRILKPGGRIRIVVPDIRKQVDKYLETGDANFFIDGTHLCLPKPTGILNKIRFLLVGPRNHQYMYDGNSLVKLLEDYGFVKAEVLPIGTTKIVNHRPLNLREREDESVYVEAEKPA